MQSVETFVMMETIQFNNQIFFNTDKVSNIGLDRVLPAKLVSIQTTVFQVFPQVLLRLRRLLPHISCKTEYMLVNHLNPLM